MLLRMHWPRCCWPILIVLAAVLTSCGAASQAIATRSCGSVLHMIQNHEAATPTVSCVQARRLMHGLLGGSEPCYGHGYTAHPSCRLAGRPVVDNLRLEGFDCSATYNSSMEVSRGRCVQGRKLVTGTAGP